ncbi:MAG: polysaccharide biosynthesis tyrosine autokinase, partial [Brevundimonas sp.]
MELSEYTAALRKRWYVILLITLLAGGAGFAYAKSMDPAYKATAKVFVAPSGGDTVGDRVQSSTYAEKLVQSFAQLSTMPVVLSRVADDLNLDVPVRRLAHRVSAQTQLDTFIIAITATGPTGKSAADLANSVANQLSSAVAEIAPNDSGGGVTLEVVAPADAPNYPYAPNTKMLTATGLALGLAIGVTIAIAIALLDTRVRTPRDIAKATDEPVLGVIPYVRGKSRAATFLKDPTSPLAEAYRRLQTNLRFLDAEGTLRSMVITSAVPQEGKSTTAMSLAQAVAEKVDRVLLIDADLRRPTVARFLGLEGSAGLTSVLIGSATLEDVVQPWGTSGLDILAAGEIPPNPSQLIDSAAMAAVVAAAVERYDLVIIDTPPLLPVADAAILTHFTDGALVVAGCRRVRRPQLQGALEALDTVGGRVLGVVANGVRINPASTGYTYASSHPTRRWHKGKKTKKAATAAASAAAARPPAHLAPAPQEQVAEVAPDEVAIAHPAVQADAVRTVDSPESAPVEAPEP